MKEFETLLRIAKRKNEYDKNNPWTDGALTYLSEMKKELDEVLEELEEDRLCYLEEELGDILWDYLNFLLALIDERNISIQSVINRANQKYEERVSGLENNIDWEEIKKIQKKRLKKELEETKIIKI